MSDMNRKMNNGSGGADRTGGRMKVIASRAAAVLLAVCVCLSGVVCWPLLTQESAAAKTKKLSASYVTLVQGGSKTVKLSAGSGKWKIRDTKIAAIKSKKRRSVKVVPRKPGTTVLVCKSGSSKLKCTIRVLNKKRGKLMENRLPAVIVGKTQTISGDLDEGMKVSRLNYDTKRARVTRSQRGTELTLKVKGKKAGRFKLEVYYNTGEYEIVTLHIVPGFRGGKSVANTKANYRKWRRAWVKNAVTQDMTTWEVIDAVGYLISSGKYASVGNNNGRTLWYTGKGTCVSGAKMMNDFMKDLGISSKVRFAGGDGGTTDAFGYYVSFGSGHKNTKIWLAGNKYILNPQPGFPWPIGIIRK